ncbi:bacteriophage Lambda NinG family protein [Escherichia coli 08BKT055439]|nr:bacteriophage Lambda NinG family protein [Escherichia coli 08BKT055439]
MPDITGQLLRHLNSDLMNAIFTSNAWCATTKSGNLVPYRVELISRIGQEAVEKSNQTITASLDCRRVQGHQGGVSTET